MPTATLVPRSSPPKFSKISDSQLPLLASQAAIEFDCALNGSDPFGFSAAVALGDVLKHFAEPATHNPDQIAVGLVALSIAESAQSAHEPQALVKRTVEVGTKLLEDVNNRQKWPELRDFCASFAQTVIEYRQSMRSLRPANPNRR